MYLMQLIIINFELLWVQKIACVHQLLPLVFFLSVLKILTTCSSCNLVVEYKFLKSILVHVLVSAFFFKCMLHVHVLDICSTCEYNLIYKHDKCQIKFIIAMTYCVSVCL